jgi:hypothetical protein
MPEAKLPGSLKRDLHQACQNAVDEVSKLAPGEKREEKLAKLLSEKVCKDVDQKILTLIAEELAKVGKKHSAKEPPGTLPKITGVPTLKPPGSGSPSFTIPLPEIDLGDDTKGKFELKIWGDPKELQKADKGAAVFFTVNF